MKKLLFLLVFANCIFSACDKFENMSLYPNPAKKEAERKEENESRKLRIESSIRELKNDLESAKYMKFQMIQKIDGGYFAFDEHVLQKVGVIGNLDHINNGQYFTGYFRFLGKTKYFLKKVNQATGATWDQEEYLNSYQTVDRQKIEEQISKYEKELREISFLKP